MYDKVLLDLIEHEKNGTEYVCSDTDKKRLQTMFNEINYKLGTNICHLAEADAFNIKGAGDIMAKYIMDYSSESVRAFLVPQMVLDKIKDCDKLILALYLHFKASDEYIAKPGKPSPAHIYVRYDNAFKELKSERLSNELLKLARSPRDAYYLPFTMRMLASWKKPEMLDLLLSYANADRLTAADIGIYDGSDLPYYPPLDSIKRELKFTAIAGLKHYPTQETKALVETISACKDKDIQTAAKKTLKAITELNEHHSTNNFS